MGPGWASQLGSQPPLPEGEAGRIASHRTEVWMGLAPLKQAQTPSSYQQTAAPVLIGWTLAMVQLVS